jgi:hypothetical protein
VEADQLADVIAVGSAVIALGSLAVAFWIGRRQVKQSAEQTALQARVTAIEEARRIEEVEARLRALVTASFGALGIRALSNYDRTRPHLFLSNEGSAQARRVDVKVAALDKNPGGFEVLRLADDLPIDLHPEQRVKYVLAYKDPLRRVRVDVRWEDDAGGGEASYTLQIPTG